MLTPYSAIIEKLRKWYPRANALSIGFGKNSVVIANSWYREIHQRLLTKFSYINTREYFSGNKNIKMTLVICKLLFNHIEA